MKKSAILVITWLLGTQVCAWQTTSITEPPTPLVKGVAIANLETPALKQLQSIIASPITQLNNKLISAISSMTNTLIKTTADIVFAFDTQMPFDMLANSKLLAAKQAFTTNIDKALDNKVNETLNFDPYDNKINIDLNPPFAADDTPVGKPPKISSFWSQTTSSVIPSAAQIAQGNALFNINSILATTSCSPAQQTTFNLALKYIDPLSSLNIVRTGYSFKINFSPKNNKNGTLIQTKEDNDKQNLQSLRLTLLNNESYRKYKHAYRSLLIARNIYLSIFYDALYRRIPDHNQKSIAQLEDEQIANYTSDTYYRELAKAPVGTLLRENIIIQAKLLNEIHNMRKDLEKQRIMEAVANLQSLNLNSSTLVQQARDTEKAIYQWKFPNDKDIDVLTEQTAGIPIPKT